MLLRLTTSSLVSLVLAIALYGQTAVPDVEFIQGKVSAVTDGDQITVKTTDAKVFAIRLQGIDAPEPDQPYGDKARLDLEALLLGKDVSVVVHRIDAQGRYVGTVFFNGQDIGGRMLENGGAWHYKRVSSEQSSDVRARYAKAELKARESKAGLWAEPMPIPPWEFREDLAEEKATPPKQDQTAAKAPDTPKIKNAAVATDGSATDAGKKYFLGPRGGCYYLSATGEKVYVKDKSLCSKP